MLSEGRQALPINGLSSRYLIATNFMIEASRGSQSIAMAAGTNQTSIN